MRIAVAQIVHETNSFNPIPCTLKDFENGGLYTKLELLERMKGVGEIGGFLSVAEEERDVEILPIVRAASIPGGKITREVLAFFQETLLSGIQEAGHIDGVFLSLHGAAAADTVDDVEGYLLKLVRNKVGNEIPIVVSLDHHANVTKSMINSADVLLGYQKQPHDPYETGVRAAQLLISQIRGKLTPTVFWEKIPMIAPTDRMLTAEQPMKTLYDLARKMEAQPGVIAVSYFLVQPWLDAAELGWSVVVITNNDMSLAGKLTSELASKMWELKREFWVVNRLPVEEGIRQAVGAEEQPILVPDKSDCVLCGAPGDNVSILQEMLRQKIQCGALIPVVDAEVVEQAIEAGVGEELTVKLGGKLDNIFSKPIKIKALVRGVAPDGMQIDIHFGTYNLGKVALLQVGEIMISVSQYRGIGGIHPAQYRFFGIEPAEAKIIVVKSTLNFQYYQCFTKRIIQVDSPGISWWQLQRFSWQNRPHPLYPLDVLDDWASKPMRAR